MSELSPEKRIAGILAPVTALRGKGDLGIGDAAALVEFASWAAEKGFGIVQILPFNETGADHSPYNILSSMAIEPATIATVPEWLPDLSPEDFKEVCAKHDLDALRAGPVRYTAVKALKRDLLLAAFRQFRGRGGDRMRARAFAKFETTESDWLEPYAIFRSLVEWNGTEVTEDWPAEHRTPAGAAEWAASLPAKDGRRFRDLIRFFSYVQWIAYSQWKTVRAACDRLGVALIGDIPVGVSIYSADVWAEPGIFDLTRSSGAPPEKIFKSDPFTEQWGQNWGFPLYDWREMSRDNFAWWRRRLRAAREIFHFLRVDHALGFFRIYSFPWRPQQNERFIDLSEDAARAITGGPLPGFVPHDDSSEQNREYNRRQGEMLLSIFVEETGPHRLVAEDLGEVAPYVRPTLEALAIPGFKIPQWERRPDGSMIPGQDYQRLSLATFATHDHPTIRQFWEEWAAEAEKPETREHALRCMREMLDFCGSPGLEIPRPFDRQVHAAFVRGLFATNSWLAVHQITDLLGLSDRFNVPGAVADANWTARLSGTPEVLDRTFAEVLESAVSALHLTGRHLADG
ncbi:MAG: 4-alpha-glucanotransferase [Terrimicrobiaceae bacterium]|nr:4-alpha-glucanotransferase [Terrimicrobiaceae bacterium]